MAVSFADWTLDGEIIYQNDFSNLDDLWAEGSPDMTVEKNRLILKTTTERTDDYHWVMTAFIRKQFEGDLMLEFKAKSLDAASHRNFNVFIHTTLPDGRDLYETREERTGDYPNYHVMSNYLFTSLPSELKTPDGVDMFRHRLRRDPGFQLRKEVHSYRCENFRWYTFKYLVKSGHISVCVDDIPTERYTWVDDTPLTGGLIGLRTYMSQLMYKDLVVYRIRC